MVTGNQKLNVLFRVSSLTDQVSLSLLCSCQDVLQSDKYEKHQQSKRVLFLTHNYEWNYTKLLDITGETPSH